MVKCSCSDRESPTSSSRERERGFGSITREFFSTAATTVKATLDEIVKISYRSSFDDLPPNLEHFVTFEFRRFLLIF
jgi:hypothetical protein